MFISLINKLQPLLLSRTLEQLFSDQSEMGTWRSIAIVVFLLSIFGIVLHDVLNRIGEKLKGTRDKVQGKVSNVRQKFNKTQQPSESEIEQQEEISEDDDSEEDDEE